MAKGFGRRPTSPELAQIFGTSADNLQDLLTLDGVTPNPNKVIEFFLHARSDCENKIEPVIKSKIEDELGHKIVFAAYEWVTFHLPGTTYTPDWSYLLDDGRWVRVEIKASKFQPGYKDARSKLTVAAALNPWDVFYQVMPIPKIHGGGLNIELIKPDPDFVTQLLYYFQSKPEDDQDGSQDR